MPVLSDEIDNTPAAIALLHMGDRERCHFRAAETAAKKNGKNGAIAESADGLDVRRVQERLSLPLR